MSHYQPGQPQSYPAYAASEHAGAQPPLPSVLDSHPQCAENQQLSSNHAMLAWPAQAPLTRQLPRPVPNGPRGPPAPWPHTLPGWMVPSDLHHHNIVALPAEAGRHKTNRALQVGCIVLLVLLQWFIHNGSQRCFLGL